METPKRVASRTLRSKLRRQRWARSSSRRLWILKMPLTLPLLSRTQLSQDWRRMQAWTSFFKEKRHISKRSLSSIIKSMKPLSKLRREVKNLRKSAICSSICKLKMSLSLISISMRSRTTAFLRTMVIFSRSMKQSWRIRTAQSPTLSITGCITAALCGCQALRSRQEPL